MSTITLKGIIDEDFVNYKVPSMVLMFPKCDFKCGSEYCQNSSLAKSPDITINVHNLCQRFINSDLAKAVVCQGLDPMDSFLELQDFIVTLRVVYYCDAPIVIYTGYNKEEIKDKINLLTYRPDVGKNIIIKYGRYIPNQKPHYDEVLGVYLASDNQYAERIS